jgi:hypothetical protein
MKKTSLNTIIKMLLVIVILTKALVIPVSANTEIQAGIPVRFQSDISTRDIEQGNAIPLEIVHDIYIEGRKVFAQGGAGYAYIDQLQQARSLGRAGKMTISRGVLVDINGRSHEIYLNANAQGSRRIMPIAGGLMAGAASYGLVRDSVGAGSVLGLMFGTGAVLSTVAIVLSKGKEATISAGKVMFATLAS